MMICEVHYRKNRLGVESIACRLELPWMAVLVGGILLVVGQQRGKVHWTRPQQHWWVARQCHS